MSELRTIVITMVADSAYDDPSALIEDLSIAARDGEDVSIHIAGNVYHVKLTTTEPQPLDEP